jgi:hypothetical protein
MDIKLVQPGKNVVGPTPLGDCACGQNHTCGDYS